MEERSGKAVTVDDVVRTINSTVDGLAEARREISQRPETLDGRIPDLAKFNILGAKQRIDSLVEDLALDSGAVVASAAAARHFPSYSPQLMGATGHAYQDTRKTHESSMAHPYGHHAMIPAPAASPGYLHHHYQPSLAPPSFPGTDMQRPNDDDPSAQSSRRRGRHNESSSAEKRSSKRRRDDRGYDSSDSGRSRGNSSRYSNRRKHKKNKRRGSNSSDDSDRSDARSNSRHRDRLRPEQRESEDHLYAHDSKRVNWERVDNEKGDNREPDRRGKGAQLQLQLDSSQDEDDGRYSKTVDETRIGDSEQQNETAASNQRKTVNKAAESGKTEACEGSPPLDNKQSTHRRNTRSTTSSATTSNKAKGAETVIVKQEEGTPDPSTTYEVHVPSFPPGFDVTVDPDTVKGTEAVALTVHSRVTPGPTPTCIIGSRKLVFGDPKTFWKQLFLDYNEFVCNYNKISASLEGKPKKREKGYAAIYNEIEWYGRGNSLKWENDFMWGDIVLVTGNVHNQSLYGFVAYCSSGKVQLHIPNIEGLQQKKKDNVALIWSRNLEHNPNA